MNPRTTQQERLEAEALSIPNQARSIVVHDQTSLFRAGEMLTQVIKPLRREAADIFDPIIATAHAAHKEALAGKAKVEKPLIEAEDILKRSIGTHLQEQERLRVIEEARLRREAQEREQQQMREAEERRRAEEKALNEQLAREHEEEMERQIETAEAFGDPPGEVAALCNTPAPAPIRLAPEMPVFAPVPTVARTVAPAGISTTERYRAEVTNIQLLCRAIANGELPTSSPI